MKKLFSFLMFSFLTFNLVAKEFEVPKNYVLKKKKIFQNMKVKF